MSACEKCWEDAYLMSISSRKSQIECYEELLEDRDGNQCSPEEQAGQWWDEVNQRDKRIKEVTNE